jgi:EAL domain-containing protein (putative c-di-GMP-specific phosphodiesterase class I)
VQDEDKGITGWDDPLARLREALANDEFVLYGQPIHALQAGGGAMAEVLVRLREEERALLPPGDFLPAFEHYGMLPQLDAWVLRRLLRHHAAGASVGRFALNVSGQTLASASFVRLFSREARLAGVDPATLLFEIEEGDLVARPREALAFATAVRAAGGGVVVGGIGRKLVSFEPAAALKPQFVKVDGAIVRRCAGNEACARKLAAIVRVCAVLRIGVIGECVEEPEVLTQLRRLGVGWGQGFGLSRPRPIEQLAVRRAAAA